MRLPMQDQTIKCPYCSKAIPLTETLSAQIKDSLRKEYEDKARLKEGELKRREEELAKKEREQNETLAKRLSLEKAKIAEEMEKRAREKMALEIKDLKEEKEEKERLLAESRRAELELRKKTRELEEKEKALELDVARKIDSERERIRQAALEMFSEEHRLKDLEKDKKIGDMLKTIEELKRKGEQGSMQTQGEILELDLEVLLKSRFPVDVIEPVPKGIKGADIVQKVYTRNGIYCGAIAWESKRTKAWNDEWIGKLKDDQREVRAEVAVLVTETLPKGVGAFANIEGVWVSAVAVAPSLAEALRASLIEVTQVRCSAVGKNEKMEAIYNYLVGAEFRQKVEAILESFMSMRKDLDAEKRAMQKIWSKREKQIEKVLGSTSGMYGDLQGIIGSTLPEIRQLELDAGVEEETD